MTPHTPPGARSMPAAPRPTDLVALRVLLSTFAGARRIVDLLAPRDATQAEVFDRALGELQRREPNAERWSLDRVEIGHEPLHVR